MADFEIEENGMKFVVTAPDEQSALAAYKQQKTSGALDKMEVEEPLTPRNEQRKKVRDQMGGFGGGFNQVVPWQDEIIATMATPLGMVTRHMAGEDKEEGWGESIANAWSEEHQNIEQQNKEYDERHPILSTVQNIAGGLAIAAPARIAGMAPSAAAALPAAQRMAVPAMEATIPQRVAKSTGIGAGIGAAYGTGEGDNLSERLDNGVSGALWGGGVGLGAQVGGEVVRGVGNAVIAPLARTMRNPERQARVTTTQAMTDDLADGATRLPERGLTPGEFQYAQERGYPVANVDRGGENVTGVFDTAYQRSGSARNAINDFVAERDTNMLPMTEEVIDGMLQSPGDIARRRANLRSGRARVAPLYEEAFNHPNAQAMWDEGYSQLMGSDIGQQAMKNANKILLDEAALAGGNRVRHPFREVPVQATDPNTGQMVNTGMTRIDIDENLARQGFAPNLRYWNAVKQGFDELIEGERDAIKGLSPRGRRAEMLRGNLVGNLDRMTRDPRTGESLYARARTAAGQYLGEESAAAAGAKIYKDAKSPNKSLDSIMMRMQRWSDDEREEAAQSFLEALKDDMGHRARSQARDAGHVDLSLNFLKSEKQRRVAEALLGPQRTAELEMHNMIQRVMQYRNKTAKGNSRTALRIAGEDYVAPIAGGGLTAALMSGGDPTSMTFGSMLGVVGRHGIPAINNRLKSRIAPHIAQELIGQNPGSYREVVRSLAGDRQLSNYLKLMTHPLRLAAGQSGGS
jgi:hypothetical protein